MKILSVLLLVLVVWDFCTAPHGSSALQRGYHAVTTSVWFQSAIAATHEDHGGSLSR